MKNSIGNPIADQMVRPKVGVAHCLRHFGNHPQEKPPPGWAAAIKMTRKNTYISRVFSCSQREKCAVKLFHSLCFSLRYAAENSSPIMAFKVESLS